MAKLLLGSVVGPQGPQGTPGVNGSQGPQGVPGPNEIAATTDVVGLTTGQLLYNNGGKVGSVEIVDNLLSIDPDKPLSANQGKVLKSLIDDNDSAIGQITNTGILNAKVLDGVDINTVKTSGWYFTSPSCTNTPLAGLQFHLEVHIYTASYLIQRAVANDVGKGTFERKLINEIWTPWKEIATTEVITKTLTPTNGATGNVYISRTAGKVITIDAVLTVSTTIPTHTNFCSILGTDRPVRDVQFDMKMSNGTQKILCIVNAGSGFQTLSQSIPAGIYYMSVSYIAGT